MGLDQIRDRARAQVHAQFSIPAVVRSPDGLVEVAVGARLHRNVRKPIGDLDREGFALVIEEANGIIIDRAQWEPQRNWTIDFGRNRVFNIDNVNDDEGERYVRMHVSFDRSAAESTFYLLTNDGDHLTTDEGDRLTWRN